MGSVRAAPVSVMLIDRGISDPGCSSSGKYVDYLIMARSEDVVPRLNRPAAAALL